MCKIKIMNKNPTEEEIKEQQDKMQAFYEKNLPFLRIQHDHDTMLAEIEEARVRVALARIQFANLNSPDKPKIETEKKKEE